MHRTRSEICAAEFEIHKDTLLMPRCLVVTFSELAGETFATADRLAFREPVSTLSYAELYELK